MDLTSISTIKSLLRKHNIRGPSKRMGQNFLINKNTLKKLVNSAELNKNDVVVEPGAGLGSITVELAKCAKRVIAVEKDRALIPILQETTKEYSNVEVLRADILKIGSLEIDWKLEIGNWKLVANIPYYLTAPLIRKFLESKNPPESMTLMIQKEMARRICAKPPNMSILAVSVQIYAKPAIAGYVSRSSFWPSPNVDSAIIRITGIRDRGLRFGNKKIDRELFFKVVRAGFSSPRKQLVNNLSKDLKISKEDAEKLLASAGIDPKRRAETLLVVEWTKLTRIYSRIENADPRADLRI